MRIEDNGILVIKNTDNKKSSIEKEKNFKSVLENKIDNYEKINKSKDITTIEKLFDIDIKNHKDKYVKDNGKLNILDIIDQYGGKLSSKKLDEFFKTITSLYKNKLIDDSDYFEALKWIALKINQNGMIMKMEDDRDKEILNLK